MKIFNTHFLIRGHRFARSVSSLCRSFMYVPGDKEKMVNKMLISPASQTPDIIVLDCEDGVAFNNKHLARKNIIDSAISGNMGKCSHATICIRMNPRSSSMLIEEDIKIICEVLKATHYRYPGMINLSKVESEDDLLYLDDQIRSKIDIGNLQEPIKLSIMIESCIAVVRLKELLHHFTTTNWSSFKLSNIVFGSDDYCASLGVARSPSNDEVLYARQHVANVATAYKISAIDMVETDLNDMSYFAKNCAFGAQIGFVGKQVIHPKQLPDVHVAFTPSADKVSWAVELLKEFKSNTEAGRGVFIFRNNMIDMPTVIQAQNIVKTADLIRNK